MSCHRAEYYEADPSFEPAAEGNCDALISRALSISPEDIDVRISLASIRMSQQRFDEAKEVAMGLFEEINDKEPCKCGWLRRRLWAGPQQV